MPTSGNVQVLVPLLTPYTPTAEQFAALYPYALDEFKGDDPGCSETGAERALAYLMAHYLAGGEGQIGFSGEKIDDYSYTVAGPAATSSRWYVLYRQQLDRCRDARAISPVGLTGVQLADATGLSDLHLDQNPVVRAREGFR